MTIKPISIAFMTLWPPAFAATAVTQPLHQAAPYSADVLGVSVPVVTAAVAVLGVLLARPLSPRGSPPLSLARNVLVSIILALLALVWVVDSKPGLLFALVVSIGLGFAGFSVIELIGTQIMNAIRRSVGQMPPPSTFVPPPVRTEPDLFDKPASKDQDNAAD